MIDEESGEYIPPARQYLDNLLVVHPELGQVELWKCIAWETSKLRNAMVRADSAGHIDEAARAGKAPPLVADAVVKQAETDVARRIMDLIDALNQRMAALEERAGEQERAQRAEDALTLAEAVAEAAPKELLDLLPARLDRRLH
jgi:hypothetical protein